MRRLTPNGAQQKKLRLIKTAHGPFFRHSLKRSQGTMYTAHNFHPCQKLAFDVIPSVFSKEFLEVSSHFVQDRMATGRSQLLAGSSADVYCIYSYVSTFSSSLYYKW